MPVQESVQPPAVTRDEFRHAMAGLAAAVNIITSDGPAGRAGFTATAVCSVTDDPPTLLVCLNRSASVHEVFTSNSTVCVNTLAHGQEALSNLFGGRTSMAERFAVGQWRKWVTGAPLLEGAAASFDCRISNTVSVGTHDILFCEVVAVKRQGDAHGLVYFDRQYHGVPVSGG